MDGPAHVKKLTPPQLETLAGEIRQELINGLAKSGGHLGPNLGVVELTIALHYVFTTPKDKFVWDVSHQVYVHKILTGRKDRFHTIRQTDGLNGFALRTESPHDCFGRRLASLQTRCHPRCWRWDCESSTAIRSQGFSPEAPMTRSQPC